jgi:hydroxyacylglutathione hydrolase
MTTRPEASVQIHTIETPCLGNRSYVVVDGSSAVVVDPPRDIDRIESVLDGVGARADLVLETHRHADYVSGGLELARRHRAGYVVPPGEPEPRFGFVPAVEGRELGTAGIGIRVLSTPGHTPHHVAYVLEKGSLPIGVCTGGALLHGSVGRTDLYGAHRTWPLARDQWLSARRLVDSLPPDVRLLPTHGFGSLCSATPASASASATLGEERSVNPALQLAESAYVPALVSGFGPVPRHYERLPLLNAAGPPPVDLSPPRPLDADGLQRRFGEGHWLVDLRPRREFAREHLRGAVNVEATGPLVAYLPWLLPAGAGVVLLGDDEAITSAARQLTQVGIDRPLGAFAGAPLSWAGGDEQLLATYDVTTFEDLRRATAAGAVPLDVRSRQEWNAGHVRGALHLPLQELADIADPTRPAVTAPVGEPTWVYCGGGFRAAIAASLLAAMRAEVVLVDEPFDVAVRAGLTVTDELPATYPSEPSSGRRAVNRTG